MDYDQTAMPESYDAGRGYAPDVLQRWLDTIAASVAGRPVSKILDLGCGTGRYSSALAAHFQAEVEAIDPSEKMLAEARRKPHPRVRFRQAPGEKLPLADASVDMVFMSMVFHHVSDPQAVAGECRRVLRPGGSVCMRSGTLEQAASYPFVPCFERSAAISAAMLQPRDEIVALFARAGLGFVSHALIESEVAGNWVQYVEKLSARADSVLASLTEAEFHSGLEAARKYARGPHGARPVVEIIDYFVFRRGTGASQVGALQRP